MTKPVEGPGPLVGFDAVDSEVLQLLVELRYSVLVDAGDRLSVWSPAAGGVLINPKGSGLRSLGLVASYARGTDHMARHTGLQTFERDSGWACCASPPIPTTATPSCCVRLGPESRLHRCRRAVLQLSLGEWMRERTWQGCRCGVRVRGETTTPRSFSSAPEPIWYSDISRRGYDWPVKAVNAMVTDAVDRATGVDGAVDDDALQGEPVLQATPYFERMDRLARRKEFWWEREWRKVGD